MDSELKELLLKEGLLLGPEIGKGSFGTVFRCMDYHTQISYAVKKIDLRVLRMQPSFVVERLKRECNVLENLSHPCVVKLYKTIQTENAILMIMELVLGMELFDMIVAVNGLPESKACAVFIQIASALTYMHKSGVIHRDVKPENILIQGSADPEHGVSCGSLGSSDFEGLQPRVKLIDFGLSTVLGKEYGGSVARSLVGTPRYVAPEILAIGEQIRNSPEMRPISESSSSSYTEKVDCYSSGVLLHVMLASCFPQFDEQKNVIFSDPRIARVSDAAKDLISKLMMPEPEKRIPIAQSLTHSWVQSNCSLGLSSAMKFPGMSEKLPHQVTENFNQLIHAQDSTQNSTISTYLSSTEVPFTQPKLLDNRQLSTALGVKRHISKAATRGDWSMSEVEDESLVTNSSKPRAVELSVSERGSNGELIDEVYGLHGEIQSLVDETAAKSSCDIVPEIVGGDDDKILRIDVGNEEDRDTRVESDALIVPQSIVTNTGESLPTGSLDPGQLGLRTQLLLQLQTQIAACFKKSFDAFKDDDVVMPGIVSSAVASRELLGASDTVLQKLERTSFNVLDILPDMRLAVEEGEFEMALNVFATIKEWIQKIQMESQELLRANVKVIGAVNNTLQLGRRHHRMRAQQDAKTYFRDSVKIDNGSELNSCLVGSTGVEKGASGGAVEAAQAGVAAAIDAFEKHRNGLPMAESQLKTDQNELNPCDGMPEPNLPNLDSAESDMALVEVDIKNVGAALIRRNAGDGMEVEYPDEGTDALEPILSALSMLRQIDLLLQKHAKYWSRMEVVVDSLMQQTQSAESMVNYTRNPKLRGRFLARISEYSTTWQRIAVLCESFRSKSSAVMDGKLYQFLTN